MTAALAVRLRCTEGQLYTMVIGLTLAVTLALTGIPPAMRDKPGLAAFAADSTVGRPPTPAPDAASPPPAAPSAQSGSVALPPVAAPLPRSSPSSPVVTPAPTDPDPVSAAFRPPVLGSVATFAATGADRAPTGVAFADDGRVYVAMAVPPQVLELDRDGTVLQEIAVPPEGDRDAVLSGVAVAPDGAVAALDTASGRILQIDPRTGASAVAATLLDLPPCVLALGASVCEPGIDDHAPTPTAAAFDAAGNLFVADAPQGVIWRLEAGADEPAIWHTSTDYAIGDGPTGLAVTAGGDVLFTVGTSLDPGAAAAGALYRLAVGDDGRAGARQTVASLDAPGAVAVGSAGNAYVVLRQTGAIVAIRSDGSEASRIAPPGDGVIPIDAPAGLAVGERVLLVANRATAATPANRAVLAIGVNDTPAR